MLACLTLNHQFHILYNMEWSQPGAFDEWMQFNQYRTLRAARNG